ncbi:hypothetical protein FB562_2187 [Homoserinimonas aerilata]|uniref:Uncharacterized protein n=1 Tax=Homoserinimonas aerilata TaxID=1162970 RepID=A0A542YEZ1_9MICO|nr:hypothetical protein [Homoserinimonas aerilata]TQL46663.1 hypothetical protein FB562_2187 [Homoserinimonas aerilata]
MEAIAIPAIPAALTLLLNFFAPYATALVVDPRWSAGQKKIVAIAVSIVLAALVILFALWMGWVLPAWPVLILIGILVSQASYDLVTKRTADQLAVTAGTGSSQ